MASRFLSGRVKMVNSQTVSAVLGAEPTGRWAGGLAPRFGRRRSAKPGAVVEHAGTDKSRGGSPACPAASCIVPSPRHAAKNEEGDVRLPDEPLLLLSAPLDAPPLVVRAQAGLVLGTSLANQVPEPRRVGLVLHCERHLLADVNDDFGDRRAGGGGRWRVCRASGRVRRGGREGAVRSVSPGRYSRNVHKGQEANLAQKNVRDGPAVSAAAAGAAAAAAATAAGSEARGA